MCTAQRFISSAAGFPAGVNDGSLTPPEVGSLLHIQKNTPKNQGEEEGEDELCSVAAPKAR